MIRNIKDHLTEYEFINIISNNFHKEVSEEIEQHLKICGTCAKELDAFYAAQEDFPNEKWAKERGAFISKLRQQIFKKDSVAERLRKKLADFLKLVCYNMAYGQAAKASSTMERVSNDSRYGIFIEEEPNGDVKIYLDTTAMELEGRNKIRLSIGEWTKDIQLKKVTDKQLGAKVLISRAERDAIISNAEKRNAISEGTILRFNLLD